MRISILLVLLAIGSFISAQETMKMSLFDKLYEGGKIKITLTYPFDSLYKKNNEEILATISITTDSGELMQDQPLTLSLRGKFRRMKCSMPPLLLNFKKSTLKELNLSSVDEIKLVTHCLEGPEGESNLEEERLLYQVYETITPLSYRTIWVNIDYCNLSNPGECIKTVGFLLEPDKVISNRFDLKEKKLFNVAEDSIHYDSYANAAAYNFLIGNRDWSIIASRNAKLFYNDSLGKYMVIPYDFDYANIVGASYRRETLPKSMEHPFDRIYEGEYYKSRSGEILKTFSTFEKTIQAAILSAINPMDAERRKKIWTYFEGWFDMVNKKKPGDLQYGTVCPYTGGL